MREKTYRILVVDDEESVRRNLQVYLEDEGFEVFTVDSGEEGLEALVRDPADAAIVDIRLHGMDGNRFIESAHSLYPGMKFIIYTGSVSYRLPERLQSMGIEESQIFRKPLSDMSILADALKNLIRKGKDND